MLASEGYSRYGISQRDVDIFSSLICLIGMYGWGKIRKEYS
jgi:hypothetical protein